MLGNAPDLVESVKPDTLPESFRVKLRDPEKFQEISDRYKDTPGIDDIVDQRQLLGKVFSILGSIQSGKLADLQVQHGVEGVLLEVGDHDLLHDFILNGKHSAQVGVVSLRP